jgi:phospholipid/cholesterol/gamma-HCH transport system substrate-binding protein
VKNLARRTLINLIAIAVLSSGLIIYALAQLLTGALLDDTYPLTVQMPSTGGLIQQQEVTLSGVPVGLVEDFELDAEHVNIKLAIDEGRKIPVKVDAIILRRSAVGEQAIDFRPYDGAGEEFFKPGDVVTPRDVVTPVEVQRLLTLADEVFSPIDPENAGKLISELADIARGRRDDIRSIISDSAEFSADIADNGQDYDRLFREGRKVTRSLAANRHALGRSLGDMAHAAAVLADMRVEFEGLLKDAPPLLTELTSLLDRGNPNLSCLITDFAEINEYISRPRQMHNIEQALMVNQWFFVGFDVITPEDHAGRVWNRLQFIPPSQPPARSYLPEKRPVPKILPGGACQSPFGPGAGSATQRNWAKRVPDTHVIRPANDRREPVRVTSLADVDGVRIALRGPRPVATAAQPTAASSVAGGGAASFLIGLLLTGAAAPRARRRLRALAQEERP